MGNREEASGLKNRIEKALAKLHYQFGWQGDILYTREPETYRIKIAENAIEIASEAISNPTDDDLSLAFWYEKLRTAEATFFLLDKDRGGAEALFLASRIALPNNSFFHSARSLALLLQEAFVQIRQSQQKLSLHQYGDLGKKSEEIASES